MKNLDLISKRIAVTGITICSILLCASMLVFSIRSIGNAEASSKPNVKAPQSSDISPLGISDGFVYYIYTGDKWEFSKIPTSKAVTATWPK
jgi:hypothetical protein